MTGKAAAKAGTKTEPEVDDAPLTGVYVAKEPLAIDGVLAFAEGDIVPAGHVKRFEWRDKVRDFDDNNEGED